MLRFGETNVAKKIIVQKTNKYLGVNVNNKVILKLIETKTKISI